MFKPIPLSVPKSSMFKGGWFGLCKFCHLHGSEQGAINWCKVMNNPHCYIPSVQATIATYSSSMSTPRDPCFLILFFHSNDLKKMSKVCANPY